MAMHLNSTYLKGFMAEHELTALSGAVKTPMRPSTAALALAMTF